MIALTYIKYKKIYNNYDYQIEFYHILINLTLNKMDNTTNETKNVLDDHLIKANQIFGANLKFEYQEQPTCLEESGRLSAEVNDSNRHDVP